MVYLGIDPGVTGGIALIQEAHRLVRTHKMPDTPGEVVAAFRTLKAEADGIDAEIVAMLELVQLRPRQRGALTIGRGFGRLETALAVAGIPFDIVTAAKWQKAMQCESGGDKRVTKLRAQQLFPHVAVTHATADSLLIAEYCRRFHCGMLPQKENVRVKKVETESHLSIEVRAQSQEGVVHTERLPRQRQRPAVAQGR